MDMAKRFAMARLGLSGRTNNVVQGGVFLNMPPVEKENIGL